MVAFQTTTPFIPVHIWNIKRLSVFISCSFRWLVPFRIIYYFINCVVIKLFGQTTLLISVFLRDGPDQTSPQIGQFSGNTALESVYSTSNQILIKFHSDFTTSGFFVLSYHGKYDKLYFLVPVLITALIELFF